MTDRIIEILKTAPRIMEKENHTDYFIDNLSELAAEINAAFEENIKNILGDHLCDFCPLEKKCVYSVPGGYAAGCEGSKCSEALDIAIANNFKSK